MSLTLKGEELRLAFATSPDQAESPLAKFLISGGVALVYEFAIGHYLEFIKIVKQTKSGTYWQLTKEITSQKGIAGVWDGFVPWGAGQALAKGAVFGWAHTIALNLLTPLADRGQISPFLAQVAAGGIGGGVQGFVLSPMLLLKTRVMTDPLFRNKMDMWETSKQSAKVGLSVIRTEGVGALMKGSGIFAMKRVADWATRFMFCVLIEDLWFKRGNHASETICIAIIEKKLSTSEKLISSLSGGILSALATLPIDVLVAQIQQASAAGKRVGVLTVFADHLKHGGLRELAGFATRGFVARALHVGLTTMLMKTATSTVYDWYNKL